MFEIVMSQHKGLYNDSLLFLCCCRVVSWGICPQWGD